MIVEERNSQLQEERQNKRKWLVKRDLLDDDFQILIILRMTMKKLWV